MNDNVINATFDHNTEITTKPSTQWNRGQVLKISGIYNLPAAFEVEVSNDRERGAKRYLGHDYEFVIPDGYFESGKMIYIWIMKRVEPSDITSKYLVKIPLRTRQKPLDYDVDPEKRDIVAEAIVALQDAEIGINTKMDEVIKREKKVERIEESFNNLTAFATTLPAGSEATVDKEKVDTDEENYMIFRFGIPQGIQGERGEKGEKGDVGETGNGIQNAILNPDYTLTINFTNGTSTTTTPIRGTKGDKGDAFTYSDFTPEQLASLKGEKGDKGDKGDTGEQGVQGEKGDKGDTYTLTPEDRTEIINVYKEDMTEQTNKILIGLRQEISDAVTTIEGHEQTTKEYSEQAGVAKTDAETAKLNAETSATNASESASSASASASTASASATSAGTSAQTATTAASTATTKASEAAASEAAALSAKTDAETARDAAAQSASEAAESARTLTIDDTLTQAGQAADSEAVGGAITELKNDLGALFYYVTPNENGEFIWPLRSGYWTTESDSVVWHPVTNNQYLASAYPIKVKSGDIIHLKDAINIKFFVTFSADGSTWAILSNTTNHDVSILSDGYVLVSARKEPINPAFTDEDIKFFFEKYLTIYRKIHTNRNSKRIDNINDVKNIVVNEVAYVQSYVTASASTTEGGVAIPIEISASKGETFIIKADFSVTHPEFFSDIKLSIRERYNNTTISNERYANLSEPIEYTVKQTSTTSIIFTVVWVKKSDSSVTTGYYENFDYRICVAKKNDELSDVITESGETWEV